MTRKEIIKELEDRDITYSLDGDFISCNINTLAAFIEVMVVTRMLKELNEHLKI